MNWYVIKNPGYLEKKSHDFKAKYKIRMIMMVNMMKYFNQWKRDDVEGLKFNLKFFLKLKDITARPDKKTTTQHQRAIKTIIYT